MLENGIPKNPDQPWPEDYPKWVMENPSRR